MTHNNGRSRSPSGWHEDAIRNRDAGHDEMQAEMLRQILKRDWSPITRNGQKFFFEGAWIEVAISDEGRILGFADIGIRFGGAERKDDGSRRSRFVWWYFLELKPVIGSVGAVVRQVRATSEAAFRCAIKCDVFAVVYGDDPKFDLLSEVGGVEVVPMTRPGAQS